MRTHYRGMVGDWEQWLFVSRAEMKGLVHDTGWRIERILGGRPTEEYVAVLEKEALSAFYCTSLMNMSAPLLAKLPTSAAAA